MGQKKVLSARSAKNILGRVYSVGRDTAKDIFLAHLSLRFTGELIV